MYYVKVCSMIHRKKTKTLFFLTGGFYQNYKNSFEISINPPRNFSLLSKSHFNGRTIKEGGWGKGLAIKVNL